MMLSLICSGTVSDARRVDELGGRLFPTEGMDNSRYEAMLTARPSSYHSYGSSL